MTKDKLKETHSDKNKNNNKVHTIKDYTRTNGLVL